MTPEAPCPICKKWAFVDDGVLRAHATSDRRALARAREPKPGKPYGTSPPRCEGSGRPITPVQWPDGLPYVHGQSHLEAQFAAITR